ncbi:MAG TPA: hypothetical protein ENI87_07600 [bacterium]|nr:hypothetical protein [bacterium]
MNARTFLTERAPWLAAAELGTCIVGSQALAYAGHTAGIEIHEPGDIDLSWALDTAAGRALLERHGVFEPTTQGNLARGTLAMKLSGVRVEITTFRAGNPDATLAERIRADLSERDMTIGAIAVELATGTVHDPFDGLQHYRERRVVAVGDPAQRVREHGIRWLRYYRKAHELGFAIDNHIRSLHRELDPVLLDELPREAVALELRAIVTKCRSPGRCLLELHEAGLLAVLSPELALQFDGRPAGPQRWHPEVSQALHLILALEWAVANTSRLEERERAMVLFAVLCHDLGKGDTRADDFPRHRGHEHAGVPHIDRLAARWPGLMDQRTVALCRRVAMLHLLVRDFAALRPGTLARLYDEHFRARDFPVEAFALAVAADSAGRLGCEANGETVREQVRNDIERLRAACARVDAAALRARHGDDIERFRAALHEARTRAIAAAPAR